MLDHTTLLTAVCTFLEDNAIKTSDYNYIGILPEVDKRYTLENFGFSNTPALGAAMSGINYDEQLSLGTAYPYEVMQVIMIMRDSGNDLASSMPDYHARTQDLENLLLAQSRTVPFGLDDIQSMRLMDLDCKNSFFSKIDKDRWAFYVAVFTVELQLSGT